MARYTQRNVPVVEACRFYDEYQFYEWADYVGLDFQYVGQDDIRFRVKQTMAAEEWRTVRPGDWIIHGVFDSYVMDDQSFRSYYEILE